MKNGLNQRNHKYGRLIKFNDGNQNRMEIFYGDNSNNLVNSDTQSDFAHAYVTGIRLDNQLSKQFDYDIGFMQVDTITDESGNTTRFIFDSFGRLKTTIDADGNTFSTHSYAYSRDMNGGVFNSSLPNYTRNKLFFDAVNIVTSYDFHNGRGRTIQSVLTADGYDFYSASEVDMADRVWQVFKTYSKNAVIQPSYDSLYRQRDDYGNNTGSNTFRSTTTYFHSLFDKQVDKVEFPGPVAFSNQNFYSNNFVSAENRLGTFYPPGSGVNWLERIAIDENGSQTKTYFDELGNKVLQRSYIFGENLQSTSAAVSYEANSGDGYEITFFTVPTAGPVAWTLWNFTNDPGLAFTAIINIKSGGVIIDSEITTTSGTVTRSFQAVAGATYSLELIVVRGGVNPPPSLLQATASVNFTGYPLIPVDTYFQYDGAGNLTWVYPPNYFNPPAGSTADDWVTEYDYNTLNLLTRETTPDAGTTDYLYDKNGNLRFVEDANGKASGYFIYYKYDNLNRKIEEGKWLTPGDFNRQKAEDRNFPPNTNFSILYTYDVAAPAAAFNQTNLSGRLSSVLYKTEQNFSKDGLEYYSYDKRGNINRVDKYIPINPTIQSVPSIQVYIVSDYMYDLQNNVTYMHSEARQASQSSGEHIFVWYNYDGLGRLSAVYAADSGTKPSTPEATYTYTPSGRVLRQQLGGGIQGFDYLYTARDWVSQINHPDLTPDSDPGGDGNTGMTYFYRVSAVDQQNQESGYSNEAAATYTGN